MLSFAASPLPAGTYDLVIVGQSSAGVVYSPTVVTGVAPGETVSVVSLHALPGVSAAPAVLHGMLDVAERGDSSCRNRCRRPTERAGGGVEYADGDRASRPGPLGIELSLVTSSGASCSAGTSCVSYDLKTSAGPAFVGAYSAGTITLTQSTLPASYIVDAIAAVPASGGTLDCSPSELKSAAPVAGTTVLVPTLVFAGCQ